MTNVEAFCVVYMGLVTAALLVSLLAGRVLARAHRNERAVWAERVEFWQSQHEIMSGYAKKYMLLASQYRDAYEQDVVQGGRA